MHRECRRWWSRPAETDRGPWRARCPAERPRQLQGVSRWPGRGVSCPSPVVMSFSCCGNAIARRGGGERVRLAHARGRPRRPDLGRARACVHNTDAAYPRRSVFAIIVRVNMPQTMAGALYDEMHADGDGGVRAHYRAFQSWLESQSADAIAAKRAEADLIFHRVGITFAVYGDDQGTERLIPFDIIPRIIPAAEWKRLEAGLRQRVKALNRFIHDIYHGQSIVRAGVIPPEQIFFQLAIPARDTRRRRRRRHIRPRGGDRPLAAPRPWRPDPVRTDFFATRSTGPRCKASTSPATSTPTLPGSTSCAPTTANSMCSRTTCGCPRACPTCSRTAR